MADVYDFCRGTKFEGREYLCVKRYRAIYQQVPVFDDKPEYYEFALGIIEDRLVWEGDKLYSTSGVPYVANVSLLLSEKVGGIEDLSWNPPAPPTPKIVSISVNGEEPIVLVLPDGSKEDFRISSFSDAGGWKNFKDLELMVCFIRNLLEGKL